MIVGTWRMIVVAVLVAAETGALWALWSWCQRLRLERRELFEALGGVKQDLREQREVDETFRRGARANQTSTKGTIRTLRATLAEHNLTDPTLPSAAAAEALGSLPELPEPRTSRVGDGVGQHRSKGGPAPTDRSE